MRLEAHAKINWTLEVLGMRPDGYHELRSVVLPVALHDVVDLAVESVPDGCGAIEIDGCGEIPLTENLAYIAAKRLLTAAGKDGAFRIRMRIAKRIPAGAGLGGGSADAAAVLRGLNAMAELGFGESQLLAVAAEVGSDVPALVLNAPAMMEGRGERVRRLTDDERAAVPKSEDIVLLMPPAFVSTAAVYAEFRDDDCGKGRNDLQPAALRLCPAIGEALDEMRARGLGDVAMSGSGSAVYGIVS